jgi:hypothetical protein
VALSNPPKSAIFRRNAEKFFFHAQIDVIKKKIFFQWEKPPSLNRDQKTNHSGAGKML